MKTPDFHKEALHCQKILKEGGLILYPTDTVWGIGCDATNSEAVKKIYQLKKRADTKAFICLVAHQGMLERYVDQVPEVAYDILDMSTKPTTIVYDKAVKLAPNLIPEDGSIALRVVEDPFCMYLIKGLNLPIVSTSANVSGQPTPKEFKAISKEILTGVDYVVNLHRERKNPAPSTIIKLGNDGRVKVIRE